MIKRKATDGHGKAYDISISWSVTNGCNFSCYGCTAEAVKVGIDYNAACIDLSGLKKTLDALKKTVHITFTGGEPLLVENIIDAFAIVTSKNYMSLITNLTHPRIKDFAERIDPGRVTFVKASAHIFELEKDNLLDIYANHYLLLKEKGFYMVNQEIAYPVLARKVEKYKKKFHDKGVDLKFQAFKGIWKGKKYPDSYTDEEYRIFDFKDIAASSHAMHYRKGKKCNAGYNAFVGYPDGSIHRCYAIPEKLGNIYTGFNLDKTLIECPLEYCDCPLSVFESRLFKKALRETRNRFWFDKLKLLKI
jgi:MoaA/NifB/PqqE/SkfB family radical SAM enzyme